MSTRMVRGLLALAFSALMINAISCGSDSSSSSCDLTDNTTASSTVSSTGCYLQTRDASSCESSRTAQGLSGFWLKFSCRVTLTVSGSNVTLTSDGQPDTTSAYFESTNACYESFSYTGRALNNNTIGENTLSFTVPLSPSLTNQGTTVIGGAVGMAANGARIYNNEAAAPDNIYDEVSTFDACDGHPDNSENYHYHIEPPTLSQEDAYFVGVLRDGYPVYGRYDDGSVTPTLDPATAWHMGTTIDSASAVGHYHVNLQSGTDGNGDPASAYFITDNEFEGTFGSCTGCN